MSIKDVEEVLQETLKEPEKSAYKSRYADSIAGYFKENKLNSEILSVVVRGVDVDRASNFFDYIETASKNDMQSIWKKIRENEVIAENKNNCGLKFMLLFLTQCFMHIGNIDGFSGNIITKLVSIIDDEKKKIPEATYKPIIYDYLIEDIIPIGTFLKCDTINTSGDILKRFFEILLSTIEELDKDECKKLEQWARYGLKYSNDMIEKERIEARIPKSKIADLQIIVECYKELEKQVRADEYHIADLEREIKEQNDEIRVLKDENLKLLSRINSLNNDIEERNKNLEEAEKEIDARKNINDAFSALKKKDEEGILNDIAEDLKLIYGQMKRSESSEMSVELGKIYKVMIQKIFKTLDKKGIRME